ELLQWQHRLGLARPVGEGSTDEVDDLLPGVAGGNGALREVKHFCARDGGGGVIPEGRDVAQVERPAGLPATRGEGDRVVHDLIGGGGHFIYGINDLIHGPLVAVLGSGARRGGRSEAKL